MTAKDSQVSTYNPGTIPLPPTTVSRSYHAKRTILNFPDSSLDVVQGQVADLLLERGEIHGADREQISPMM